MTASRMRPFERSMPMQLMLAREAVMQRFRPHLNAQGLTDQQWRIIRALNAKNKQETTSFPGQIRRYREYTING